LIKSNYSYYRILENMVGTKWFKCDLHLHTPASKCFKDRDTVTAQQWVQEAINKGLDCVAVTDHNTGAWIDQIKEAAQGSKLVVFPGVELTCSEAKVHLLILFDPEKSKQDIEDFLLVARIERESLGEQEAHSRLTVQAVIDLAKEKGAICIPAHIDEYNGLCEVSHSSRSQLLLGDDILGVQVVHKSLTLPQSSYNATARKEALNVINLYYGATQEQIDAGNLKIPEILLKDWRSVVLQSLETKKAILTFSDNPHAPGDSKHGLAGIGTRFTWIKMDQAPSLESLRQALLLPGFRIKTDFEYPTEKPYDSPALWIQRISIKDTDISHNTDPLEITFSPQMNTIIGGRGSGKSSILQFIRGVFGKENELGSLPIVQDDFKKFFKLKDKSTKQGVLKNGCVIEVDFERNDDLFKVVLRQQATKIVEVYKYNTETSGFIQMPDNSYLSLLDFDIFSQKQIFEVATNLNSLRERVDDSDPVTKAIKEQLELKAQEYKQISSEIRTLQLKLARKSLLLAEIQDMESKIDKYRASGIDVELKKRQIFQKDKALITRFQTEIDRKINQFDTLASAIGEPNISLSEFNEIYQKDLESSITEANRKVLEIKKSILDLKESYGQIPTKLIDSVKATQWQKNFEDSYKDFEQKKKELSDAGVSAVDEIQTDMNTLVLKKSELKDIEQIEQSIGEKKAAKSLLKQEFVTLRLRLTTQRRSFLSDLLLNTNVRASIDQCRDLDSFEDMIRELIGNTGFDDDVQKLKTSWAGADPIRSNTNLFNTISELVNETYLGNEYGARFKNKIKGLNGEQVDTFDLMFPEDKIKIEYRTGSGTWKQLSNVSAGQKTAAILTMILCQGKKPLLLDQPEDDLDNNLIYDLVVEQLRKTKECRQIICVTHNANIPVNGDSEHIIVMDSDTKHINTKYKGSIENPEIKKAICDIMEGGTVAFDMRYKRYIKLRD
jgi:energy-coupling factor transporter ATP-binding protein EcfA2